MLESVPVSSETLFEEMKRYVRFSEADHGALREFRVHAAPHFERIAVEFYDRIREHEDAHDVFTSEEQVRTGSSARRALDRARLLGALRRRLLRRDRQDRAGARARRLPAALHVHRDGAHPRRAPPDRGRHDGAAGRAARAAVGRALNLELAIMLETYRDDHVAY